MANDKHNVQTRTKNGMLEFNAKELLVTVLLLKYSKIICNIYIESLKSLPGINMINPATIAIIVA